MSASRVLPYISREAPKHLKQTKAALPLYGLRNSGQPHRVSAALNIFRTLPYSSLLPTSAKAASNFSLSKAENSSGHHSDNSTPWNIVRMAALAAGITTGTGIAYSEEKSDELPPSLIKTVATPEIHITPELTAITEPTSPPAPEDPSERFVDERIVTIASDKTVNIGNNSIRPVTPTHSARTPTELNKLLPQQHPFRAMIRVRGENAHSSSASKSGNGIYNATLVANELQSAIKLSLSQGGNMGFHVLKGANNITPSDVILMIDCPNKSSFDLILDTYKATRLVKGESPKEDILNYSKEEPSETVSPQNRKVSSLCVELSVTQTQTNDTSGAKETHSVEPNPLPTITYTGDTFEKKVELLRKLMNNKVVSTDPHVSSGEEFNAAEIFATFEQELKDYPKVLEAMRIYRFRVVTGQDASGEDTYVDNFLMTLGPLTKQSRKVVMFDHLDVVPAHDPKQHTLTVTEDRLIGRGTNDMYKTVISDVHGVINFYKYLSTLPDDIQNSVNDNFCIVLGFDAAEELGGPHTVDFMKAVMDRLPELAHNSVCFGEVRGFMQPVPDTLKGEQKYMLGSIYSEKGGGSLKVTLTPKRDSEGNITPESTDRLLEVMNHIRDFQDSFPTVINEPLFKNGLKIFSAQEDIRSILTKFLDQKEPGFTFVPSDTLDTSRHDQLGVPKDVFKEYKPIFDALNTLGSDAISKLSDDDILTFFSRQSVLETMGDFFHDLSKKHAPNSTFSKLYGALTKSVFTCNLVSSDDTGAMTLNITVRVLAGDLFRGIERKTENMLKHVYGADFKEHVQLASTLFREGSSTKVDGTELVSLAQKSVGEVVNTVLDMYHHAKNTPANTPDVAKKVAYDPFIRVLEALGSTAPFGTTAGYTRPYIPTIALGTSSQHIGEMFASGPGYHGDEEAITKQALVTEALGQFLMLLKLSGIYSHKGVAFGYEHYIGDQNDATKAVDSNKSSSSI